MWHGMGSTPGRWSLVLVQSVLSRNSAPFGAATALSGSLQPDDVLTAHFLSSTLSSNKADTAGGAAIAIAATNRLSTTIENCILAGNSRQGVSTEDSQINPQNSRTLLTVRTSAIEGLSVWNGPGNLDPGTAAETFVAPDRDDLRLKAGSPCIDAGSNLVDFDPTTPGFQPLPAADLGGQDRIVDGDGDGSAEVDMGAYEHQ